MIPTTYVAVVAKQEAEIQHALYIVAEISDMNKAKQAHTLFMKQAPQQANLSNHAYVLDRLYSLRDALAAGHKFEQVISKL